MVTLEITTSGRSTVGAWLTTITPDDINRGNYYAAVHSAVLPSLDVESISYRFFDPFRGKVSPVFQHEFKRPTVTFRYRDGVHIKGVRMFPIAQVWPEYGSTDIEELPQFVL